GRDLPDRGNRWSATTHASVSQLFPTGALLLVRFANQVVLNMSGTGPRVVTPSTLSMDLTQPLLQGGGKAVTLEPLTQAERNLLYSIRSYARFREQFYSTITLGNSLPGNLSSAAGTGGGAGATGSPISTLAALGLASTDV